ncbi:zinc knuckle CX2CX4HX4C containing protein [Tanacetum coccineum]
MPKGITNVDPTHSAIERNTSTPLGASPKVIQSLLEKFSADMSNLADNSFGEEQLANEDTDSVPSPDMHIVQLVSISKPVSYAGAAGALSAIPKKGNFRPLESENLYDGVDLTIQIKVVKEGKHGLTRLMMNSKGYFFIKFESRKGLEDVLKNEPWMIQDGISLIATQIGNPIMLDSFTSFMCNDSWGRSSFACYLIEVRADAALKDSVTMGIPLPDGEGFTKEMVQVEYEWKPPCCDQCKIFSHVYDQCPKNVTVIPTIDKMNNDGFQTVVDQRKSGKTGSTINNCSGAAATPKVSTSTKDDPSKKLPAKKGGPHVLTCKPSVPTSNPYDVLDDMESEEEAEAVYDVVVMLQLKRLFLIDGNRAHGHGGFSSLFFKRSWNIVGEDVCKVVKEFFVTGKLLTEINSIVITLVLKIQSPDKVDKNQSAFVPNMHIHDNISLPQELLKGYERKEGPKRVAIKIDIQKAYDTVNWKFLECILYGFFFH